MLNRFYQYLPAMVFGALLGTYMDLFFVGLKLYSFPNRPLPNIFAINILFCLGGLPLIVLLFMIVVKRLRCVTKLVCILLISLFMSVFEKVMEEAGFFVHSEDWNHFYTFIGSILYWLIVLLFFLVTNNRKGTR